MGRAGKIGVAVLIGAIIIAAIWYLWPRGAKSASSSTSTGNAAPQAAAPRVKTQAVSPVLPAASPTKSVDYSQHFKPIHDIVPVW